MRIATSRRTFLATTASAVAAVTLGGWRHCAAASAFTMQAAWINDAEFMGYFIAIDKGWYAGRGARPHLPLRRTGRHSGKLAAVEQGRPRVDDTGHHDQGGGRPWR